MTPVCDPRPPRWRRRSGMAMVVLACASGVFWSSTCGAQASAATRPPAKTVPEQGPRWTDLKPSQQASLRPLQQEWPSIESPRKKKWLVLAARLPNLTSEEQARIQTRMAEWAKLTPSQRGEARLHYQEARQLPAEDREARWRAYQALSPEQKAQLAARAVASGRAHSPGVPAKSNIVSNPEDAGRPRQIGPILVQAGPGATTTLLTRRPSPPQHQQTGMPKIAATPEFVNKATLLPQRGPQGAATRSAATSTPESAPRK